MGCGCGQPVVVTAEQAAAEQARRAAEQDQQAVEREADSLTAAMANASSGE
jgi:hypothetical protein